MSHPENDRDTGSRGTVSYLAVTPFIPMLWIPGGLLGLTYISILILLVKICPLYTDTAAHHSILYGAVILYSPLLTATAIILAATLFAARVRIEYKTATSLVKSHLGYIVVHDSAADDSTIIRLMIRNAWILLLPASCCFGPLPLVCWTIVFIALILSSLRDHDGRTFLDQWAGTRVAAIIDTYEWQYYANLQESKTND